MEDLIPEKIREIYAVMGLSMTLTAYKDWFKPGEEEKAENHADEKKKELSLILGI